MTVHEALQTIVENRELKSLNYAVDYARAGLRMREGTIQLETQLLYVLSNITHWRGPLAKEVRETLKEATK